MTDVQDPITTILLEILDELRAARADRTAGSAERDRRAGGTGESADLAADAEPDPRFSAALAALSDASRELHRALDRASTH